MIEIEQTTAKHCNRVYRKVYFILRKTCLSPTFFKVKKMKKGRELGVGFTENLLSKLVIKRFRKSFKYAK